MLPTKNKREFEFVILIIWNIVRFRLGYNTRKLEFSTTS